MKTFVVALAFSAIAASANAQAVSAAPSINPALRMTTQAPQKVSYDAQIADLAQHVKALEQENAALKAQLAKQDVAIGQLLTQIVAVKGSINTLQGMQGDLAALQTKFANHYHTYKSFGITKTDLKVETPDSISTATYINDAWWFDDKSSGPK